MLATAAASGASVVQAFADLARSGGPWSDGARTLVAEVQAGEPVQVATDRWAGAASEDADVQRLVADALAIASRSGASLARALASVAATARERAELEREVRALAAQARASAAVLVVTPIGFALLLAAVDVRVRGFFTSFPQGPACIGLGLALDALGGGWMRRSVTRVGARRGRGGEVPELIDLFLLAAAAGHGPAAALDVVAERAPEGVGPVVGAARERLHRGLPLAEAFEHLRTDLGPEADGLVSSLTQAHVTGAPLLPLLEAAARAARDRRHRGVQEAARRLPVALLFPLVACTLPAAVLLAVVPVLAVSLRSLSL